MVRPAWWRCPYVTICSVMKATSVALLLVVFLATLTISCGAMERRHNADCASTASSDLVSHANSTALMAAVRSGAERR